jgi:dolichol-phosphate mannosyltransferase
MITNNSITNKDGILISVVVALFNEQGNVQSLVERLVKVLGEIGEPYEVVLVDDGSVDSTWSDICAVSEETLNVRGLKLSRNFGHQHALVAGLSSAQGQAIVTMDGDLQHPPEVIPEMISGWKQGNKIINTRRIDSKSQGVFKRLTSKYFYKLFSTLSEVNVSEGSSDFRLLDRVAVNHLLSFKDADIFLRGAVEWIGFPSRCIDFEAGERFANKSKYNLRRMIRFAFGAMVSFSTKPLRLGIWLGVFTSSFAFLELVYILYKILQGKTVPGWASTVGILSLLFGILFIILGVIGIYIARIHKVLQERPKFIIAENTVDGANNEMPQ